MNTKNAWEERKKLVLSKVYHNLDTLIHEARDTKISTSLATFKPKRIIGFSVEQNSTLRNQRQEIKIMKEQLPKEQAKRLVQAVPFKFYYSFIDQLGKRSKLQILDWELYQLCRKLIRIYGENRKRIASLLREKYFEKMTKNCDIYLLLGTNKYWHIRRSNNPFMIIGVFYPPLVS